MSLDQPAAEGLDALMASIYGKLREIAGALMQKERKDHTLQRTALVNEALLRLMKSNPTDLDQCDRAEFVRLAARSMRNVLVDHARARKSEKRTPRELPEAAEGPDPDMVLDIDAALGRLKQRSERQAEVVELRFFSGLTLAEAAALMGISRDTAKEHWQVAKVWLNSELAKGRGA